MTGLVLKMSVSLDGFVCGPNGEIDWIFESFDPDFTVWLAERLGRADVHIMGRRTFADMAAWWPTSTEVFAAPMNAIPKALFSRRGDVFEGTTAALRDAAAHRDRKGDSVSSTSLSESWQSAEVIQGDLVEGLSSLKARYGTVLAHGGATFGQSLVASGMIDEYWLAVHPVALGRGQPLFVTLPTALPLRLCDAEVFPSGVIAKILRPATEGVGRARSIL